MTFQSWRPVNLAVSCLIAAGCSSPAQSHSDQEETVSLNKAKAAAVREMAANTAALFVSPPEIRSLWVYLSTKYDADGDGKVAAAEYDRREGQFDRWDRDGDGVLTSADFEKRKRGGQRRDPMLKGKTRRTLARYFQNDDDVKLLPLEEAQAAFAIYDGSDGSVGDGQISEGEFSCSMGDRHMAVPGDESKMVQRTMGKASAWSVLVAGLDANKDLAISESELERFFSKSLSAQVIDYSDWGSSGPSRRTNEKAKTTEGDGLAAQEGQPAPNFTLSSPDGKTTATLSQHIGQQPVALIFGSYT